MSAGLNSGVMLLRNTKWSRDFLDSVAELGRIPEPELQGVRALLHTCQHLGHVWCWQ